MISTLKNQLKVDNLQYIFKRIHLPKLAILVGVILSILGSLVQLTFPLMAQNIIDRASISSLNGPEVYVYPILAIGMVILNAISYFILAKAGQGMVAELRSILWQKIIVLPVSFFDNNRTGVIVSSVINDSNLIYSLVVDYLPSLASGMISILGSIIILFSMDRVMTLLFLLSIPLMVLVYLPFGRHISRLANDTQEGIANLSGDLTQTISENRLMKYSTAEKEAEASGLEGIKNLYHLGVRQGRLMAIISPVFYLLLMIMILGLMIYGGLQVRQGNFTIGNLIAYLLYVLQVITPLMSMVGFLNYLMRVEGATGRIVTILGKDEEAFGQGAEVEIHQQELVFDDVSFSYEKSKRPVLENISFQAKMGQKLALVGPSGGGKTTIFSLIERFYQIEQGQIRLGEESLEGMELANWRRQLGYVSQDNAMISGTIRENLYYGLPNKDDITDDDLWEVLDLAQAKKFVENLRDGLDSEIGERGVKLSGGQKQRINIARAFLRDPKILLLDEATASLDSQSEYEVTKALENLMTNRMTFVIAHRLSTIMDADLILFIEEGKITGRGTHEELQASHPTYRLFAEKQFK